MASEHALMYGGITKDELSEMLAWFGAILDDWNALQRELYESMELARRRGGDSSALQWGVFYELPFHIHIAAIFELFGLSEWVAIIKERKRPAEAVREFVAASESEGFFRHLDGLGEVEANVLLAVLISATHSLRSLSLYSTPINRLVERARSGDWDAFKSAVRIDPVAVSAPSMSSLFALGSLQDIGLTKRRLRSALKGPHAGRAPYSRLRMAQLILEEVGAMKESRERIFELVVNELRLYDHMKADAMKGLFSLFSAWKKESTR